MWPFTQIRDWWEWQSIMEEIERDEAARDQAEREREADPYWEAQKHLPLWRRDRMWWIEVAFSNIVLSIFALGILYFIVSSVVEALT